MSLKTKTESCYECKKFLAKNNVDAKENEVKELFSCQQCRLTKYCNTCLKKDKDHHSLAFCKSVLALKNEIQNLLPKVDESQDVELYASLINKKLRYAYLLWYIAEVSESYSAYETFFNYATETFNVKPNDKRIHLCQNNVFGSSKLMFYIIMALVNLGYPEEAFDTVQHCLDTWSKNEVDNSRPLNFEGFKTFYNRPSSSSFMDLCFTQIRISVKSKMNANVIDTMNDQKRDFPENGLANLFAVIIPIKIELIDKMEQSLIDLKEICNAMIEGKKDVIDSLEKKYPRLVNAKFSDISEVILGNDRKSFDVELQQQREHLKIYIEKCSKWHPILFYDVLDFDARHTSEIIQTHVARSQLDDICKQEAQWASLRSCWNYFHRLFTKDNSKCVEIIKSTIEPILKMDREYKNACVARNIPEEVPCKKAKLESNTCLKPVVLENDLDLDSVIAIPPLFKGEKIKGVLRPPDVNVKGFIFYSSQGRAIELRKRGIKCRFPLSIEFRKGVSHVFHPQDSNVCVADFATGNNACNLDVKHLKKQDKTNVEKDQPGKSAAVVTPNLPTSRLSNPTEEAECSDRNMPQNRENVLSSSSHFTFDSDRNVLIKKEIKSEDFRKERLHAAPMVKVGGTNFKLTQLAKSKVNTAMEGPTNSAGQKLANTVAPRVLPRSIPSNAVPITIMTRQGQQKTQLITSNKSSGSSKDIRMSNNEMKLQLGKQKQRQLQEQKRIGL